jgi:hypothetical protein
MDGPRTRWLSQVLEDIRKRGKVWKEISKLKFPEDGSY